MNKLERTRLPSISWKDSELEKTYLYTLEGSPYAMLISSSGTLHMRQASKDLECKVTTLIILKREWNGKRFFALLLREDLDRIFAAFLST